MLTEHAVLVVSGFKPAPRPGIFTVFDLPELRLRWVEDGILLLLLLLLRLAAHGELAGEVGVEGRECKGALLVLRLRKVEASTS